MTINVLDLFSGVGGMSLGLERAGGFKTVAFCEQDDDACSVLRAHWPDVPIFPDVRTLTRETLDAQGIMVDFVCGGFPCQDASVMSPTRQGTDGARTGLYREAIRIARDFGAGLFMENVTGLLARGFGDVLRDLAQVGYHAEWDCLSARDAGAGHERDRIWILAYPDSKRWQAVIEERGIAGRVRAKLAGHGDTAFSQWHSLVAGERMVRGSDGLRVGVESRRLRLLGNSLVPIIPQVVGEVLMELLDDD